MKKFLNILLCSLLVVPLSGCSKSINEIYPEAKKDFNQIDHDAILELSENGSLSYEDVCDKFIQENMDSNYTKEFDYIKDNLSLNNPKVHTKENTLSFSYNMSIEKYDIEGTIHFIIDREGNKLSKIYFDSKPEWGSGNAAVINIIEYNEMLNSDGLEIYNKISSDQYKDNKLYLYTNGHYYAPVANNEITIYTNSEKLEEDGYTSEKQYYKQKYEDLDIPSEEELNQITEDAKEGVKEFKEDWEELNGAIESSYH